MSESSDTTQLYRMHYLHMAGTSFGLASIMLGLNLGEVYTLVGGLSVLAYLAEVIAEEWDKREKES